MNILPLISQRVLNRPLLIHPQMADAIYGILDGRISLAPSSGAAVPSVAPEANRFMASRVRRDGSSSLAPTHGRTALITIDGSLVNRGAWVGADFCTGLVSYEGIAAQVRDAAGDPKVDNILLDINSYGGEASGMSRLAELVRKVRQVKPVVAFVDDVAASAGYGIASAASEIVISETSSVGSIGVVMLHLDRSAEMVSKGIRPTLIHAGAHKVDGHPFGPLPEAVHADMQRDVMAFYDQFLRTVSQGRGMRLTAQAARATEARVFLGQDAIKAGLADRVAAVDDVLAELSRPSREAANSSSSQHSSKGRNSVYGDPASEALAAARAEERSRIKTILKAADASGRQALAESLAFDSDMPAASAIAAMGNAPLATTALPPEARGDHTELGGGDYDQRPTRDAAQAGWKKAFSNVVGR